MKKNIIIFNLKTDADDDILGFTTDWINAFAKKFQKLFVITMYKGRDETAENVAVYSVGKEKGYWEIRRIYEFYKILFRILKENKIDLIFAHMTPEFAVLAGPVAKLRKIPIILWHAHKKVSWRLRLASWFAERIFTPSADSCRLKNRNKILITGHGINIDKFRKKKKTKSPIKRLLTVSRISPIKNIDKMILFVEKLLKRNISLKFTIVGSPLNNKDKKYYEQLTAMVNNKNLKGKINFKKSISYKYIEKEYAQADYFLNFSGTGSVDKALLEAIAGGCIPITTNEAFKNYEFYYNPEELLASGFRLPEKIKNSLADKIIKENSLERIAGRLESIKL